MSNIKGNVFLTAHSFFLEKGGKEGMEKIKSMLSEHDQELLFSKRILASSWIDYNCYIRFIFTASRTLGNNTLDLLNDMCISQAQRDFKGIYKFVVKIMKLEDLIKRFKLIWSQYFDNGKIAVDYSVKNRLVIKITDFPDMPLEHELDQLPFVEEIGRICGYPNTQATHPQCIARGDECCLFHITY